MEVIRMISPPPPKKKWLWQWNAWQHTDLKRFSLAFYPVRATHSTSIFLVYLLTAGCRIVFTTSKHVQGVLIDRLSPLSLRVTSPRNTSWPNPNLVPRAFSSTIFKMEKALGTRLGLIPKNRPIQPRCQGFSPLPSFSREPESRLRRIFYTCIKGLTQQHTSLKAPLTHWIWYYFKGSVTKNMTPNSADINLPPSLAALWFVRLTSRATTKIALLNITKIFEGHA